MSFPKPESIARKRARLRRESRAARSACVYLVFHRARSQCEACGVNVLPAMDPRATVWTVGHCHEIIMRSLGGDPADPESVTLLCQRCHAAAHRLRVNT